MEENSVWTGELLHTKWIFQTKTDADGMIERYKGRLVICGNEHLLAYGLTFADVMKLIPL